MLCLDTDLGVLGGGAVAAFLACGNGGTISDIRYATSSSGALFSQSAYSSSLLSRNGSGAYYNGNFYVPAADPNNILKLSAGGVPLSYIQYSSTGTFSSSSVAINPSTGRMVIAARIAGTNAVYYGDSPYTSFTQVTGFNGPVNQVEWLNNIFVALPETASSYAEIWTSPDGSSWTQRLVTSNSANSLSGAAILYGNSHYVIGVGVTGDPAAYFYSSDGTSWSAITAANSLAGFGVARMGAYKASNTTFYLYSPSYVAYATDPSSNSNWTVQALTSTGYDRMEISGENIVMAKSANMTNPIRYSIDGLSFSNATHPFTSPAQQGIACLVGHHD